MIIEIYIKAPKSTYNISLFVCFKNFLQFSNFMLYSICNKVIHNVVLHIKYAEYFSFFLEFSFWLLPIVNPIWHGGAFQPPLWKNIHKSILKWFLGSKSQTLFNHRYGWWFITIFGKKFLLGDPPRPLKSLKIHISRYWFFG